MSSSTLLEYIHLNQDEQLDRLYPSSIQELSKAHWTPIKIARLASAFLVSEPGTRVLDIGCGPGKFCLVGALTTSGHFTGVEQRQRLYQLARTTLETANVPNVEIVHANITEIEFCRFDAFYLFNPFEEHLESLLQIDHSIPLQLELYDTYTEHVARQLALAPLGTRVVTYCGACEEIPLGYDCVGPVSSRALKFWVKTKKHPVNQKELTARTPPMEDPLHFFERLADGPNCPSWIGSR